MTPHNFSQTNDWARHLETMGRINLDRKRRTYARLQVGEGQRVLDVGCGIGIDTLHLGEIVGPAGSVHGVDVLQRTVREAHRRAIEAGVDAWVKHHVADAYALPFAEETFDVCHAERVFEHLADPERALAEMVRVTKPGGHLVVIDGDGGSMSIATPDAETERRISAAWIAKVKNGFAGRLLFSSMTAAGLDDVTVEVECKAMTKLAWFAYLVKLDDLEARAVASNAITPEERRRFRDSLEAADARGAFFATFNMISVFGRVP